MSVRVKICGITRAEDAALAARLGAWAVGFVFAESPRRIAPAAAGVIASAVPAAMAKVGVFVNAGVDELLEIQRAAGLTALQLHGEETPELTRELRRALSGAGVQIIKTLRSRDRESGSGEPSRYAVDAFLVDAGGGPLRGGSGRLADWELARELKAYGKVILAGGLSDSNVTRALDEVRPYAVDVSSSLESAPGMKDPEKTKRFFEAVKEVRES